MIAFSPDRFEEEEELPELHPQAVEMIEKVNENVTHTVGCLSHCVEKLSSIPEVMEKLGERIQAPININPIGIQVEVAEQKDLAQAISKMADSFGGALSKIESTVQALIAEQSKPKPPKKYVMDIERNNQNFISRVNAREVT
jgi:FtsZ-binding cell division protein ZapB